MYSVYQHWDPLKVCVVGRSYPAEFYSWIKSAHVRELFERIAIETEQDYQAIIHKLQEFGVKILRPDLPTESKDQHGRFKAAPMVPRDYFVMIGKTFYIPDLSLHHALPQHILECYTGVIDHVEQQGNRIKKVPDYHVNGAAATRVGKDLYFGTSYHLLDPEKIKQNVIPEFEKDYRVHIVETSGHADGTFCPVAPGLIISLKDIPNYAETFPDWEVVYLPGQSWDAVKPFLDLKLKNHGKWWIPGFEYDSEVIDTVETWLDHWVGYVEETVFDVNMLIIDPKNVMVFNYNKQVFDALERYGITPHIVPFRHRYFWDGGIHCVTLDLDRQGVMQDYFPQRQ